MYTKQIKNFELLEQFNRIHIKINYRFFCKIKSNIIKKYNCLRRYNQKILRINYPTLKWEFKKNNYHPFKRILIIISHIGISKKELYNNIVGFYHWGSPRMEVIYLPRYTEVNEFFVEGYALYLAEGDTGFNGSKKPRKVRFTNSNIDVINHFIKWINTYYPKNRFYVNIILPLHTKIDFKNIKNPINADTIKWQWSNYNKIIKYKVCLDSAIVLDLILSMNKKIKQICSKDKKLASAYIRGMMIGEGTAYAKRSRYVRIEMKNETEIKYMYKLFTMLGFNCKPSLRTTREDMWSLYIGAKQLSSFNKFIGFGIHKERQRILEKGINKKLKVNQFT